MAKVELLCPAGCFEAFEAALYHGADAVFLAGERYGARASAANFTMEEMRRAIELAHVYGVKIHVTVNTLLHDHELEACRSYLKELEEMGVDALIVQDLGIMNIIQHEFPRLQIHASTQMHIHNIEGVEQCEKWQLERCVVARESSLELLKKMCQKKIEIEAFVQGAYCVSYSGECHMSRNIGGRSANRGECAQSCRLPYTLFKSVNGKEEKIETEGKYLLSLKDLNALPVLDQMIACGISSFKIEGRMKRPEYVACMCQVYRQAIDAYEKGEVFDLKDTLINEMKKMFNRGFTTGYLENREGLSIMSTYRPNHQGIYIGKVIGFHRDKMQIKLEGELCQHDGIRILNEKEDQGFIVNYMYKNGQLVASASNEIIELQRVDVQVGDFVMKTSDVHQLESYARSCKRNARKVKVSMSVKFKKSLPMTLEMNDGCHRVSVFSECPVEKANHTPLSKERLEKQLSKLGNTPFELTQISIEMDEDGTLPISQLNECRRRACEQLEEKRKAVIKTLGVQKAYDAIQVLQTYEIHVYVQNEEQLKALAKYPVNIYVSDFSLYQQYQDDSRIYVDYPRVNQHGYTVKGRIHDVGGLHVQGQIASPYMNCMNAYSAYVLFHEGISCVSLSYECSDDDVERLICDYEKLAQYPGNFEMEVYGRVENMILENCIIKSQLKTKKHCQQCHQYAYFIKDVKNKQYRLLGDEDCHMKVYHNEIFDKINRVNLYQKMGITNFGLSFSFEDKDEVQAVMNRFMEMM